MRLSYQFCCILFFCSLHFFTTAQAYNICRDLFFEKAVPQKELLKELIKNRTLPIVPNGHDSRGNRISWFISHSLEGETYTVTIVRSSIGEVVSLKADLLSQLEQKKYYLQASKHFKSVETLITLPRKGKRNLIIPAEVQVKLLEKHSISPSQLVEALRNISPNVKYRPNKHVYYEGRDSFLFHLEVGQRTPLEVVMLYENEKYHLITAFFPDVFYK